MDLDSIQCNAMLAAPSDVPDPRKARDKQQEWHAAGNAGNIVWGIDLAEGV
jgi:hypothetical protein